MVPNSNTDRICADQSAQWYGDCPVTTSNYSAPCQYNMTADEAQQRIATSSTTDTNPIAGAADTARKALLAPCAPTGWLGDLLDSYIKPFDSLSLQIAHAELPVGETIFFGIGLISFSLFIQKLVKGAPTIRDLWDSTYTKLLFLSVMFILLELAGGRVGTPLIPALENAGGTGAPVTVVENVINAQLSSTLNSPHFVAPRSSGQMVNYGICMAAKTLVVPQYVELTWMSQKFGTSWWDVISALPLLMLLGGPAMILALIAALLMLLSYLLLAVHLFALDVTAKLIAVGGVFMLGLLASEATEGYAKPYFSLGVNVYLTKFVLVYISLIITWFVTGMMNGAVNWVIHYPSAALGGVIFTTAVVALLIAAFGFTLSFAGPKLAQTLASGAIAYSGADALAGAMAAGGMAAMVGKALGTLGAMAGKALGNMMGGKDKVGAPKGKGKSEDENGGQPDAPAPEDVAEEKRDPAIADVDQPTADKGDPSRDGTEQQRPTTVTAEHATQVADNSAAPTPDTVTPQQQQPTAENEELQGAVEDTLAAGAVMANMPMDQMLGKRPHGLAQSLNRLADQQEKAGLTSDAKKSRALANAVTTITSNEPNRTEPTKALKAAGAAAQALAQGDHARAATLMQQAEDTLSAARYPGAMRDALAAGSAAALLAPPKAEAPVDEGAVLSETIAQTDASLSRVFDGGNARRINSATSQAGQSMARLLQKAPATASQQGVNKTLAGAFQTVASIGQSGAVANNFNGESSIAQLTSTVNGLANGSITAPQAATQLAVAAQHAATAAQFATGAARDQYRTLNTQLLQAAQQVSTSTYEPYGAATAVGGIIMDDAPTQSPFTLANAASVQSVSAIARGNPTLPPDSAKAMASTLRSLMSETRTMSQAQTKPGFKAAFTGAGRMLGGMMTTALAMQALPPNAVMPQGSTYLEQANTAYLNAVDGSLNGTLSPVQAYAQFANANMYYTQAAAHAANQHARQSLQTAAQGAAEAAKASSQMPVAPPPVSHPNVTPTTTPAPPPTANPVTYSTDVPVPTTVTNDSAGEGLLKRLAESDPELFKELGRDPNLLRSGKKDESAFNRALETIRNNSAYQHFLKGAHHTGGGAGHPQWRRPQPPGR